LCCLVGGWPAASACGDPASQAKAAVASVATSRPTPPSAATTSGKSYSTPIPIALLQQEYRLSALAQPPPGGILMAAAAFDRWMAQFPGADPVPVLVRGWLASQMSSADRETSVAIGRASG
jgi:hypothetical protein